MSRGLGGGRGFVGNEGPGGRIEASWSPTTPNPCLYPPSSAAPAPAAAPLASTRVRRVPSRWMPSCLREAMGTQVHESRPIKGKRSRQVRAASSRGLRGSAMVT